MSEVMQYTDPERHLPGFATTEVQQWTRDITDLVQVGLQLVRTPFVPRSYKFTGTGDDATPVPIEQAAASMAASIMTGRELGLSPMASLRSIDIIEGTPGMRAVMLRGLAQSAGHDVWVVESTATRAIVRGRRRGGEHVEEVVWTIERARDMKLTGKRNWQRMPIDMLLARATSGLVRLIAADLILGLPYSIEELEDVDEAAEQASPAPTETRRTKRTVRRQALPEAVAEAEPALPEAEAEAAEPRPEQPEQTDRAADEPTPEQPAEQAVDPWQVPPAEPFEGDPIGLTEDERRELEQDGDR